MNGPVLTILAGSNGSGKSTLTSSAHDEFQMAPVLDPDAIARSIRDSIPGGGSNIDAGKRVLQRAQQLIQAHESFTVETTLSGSTYLRLAAQAKAEGFLIAVIFVGTASVEINLERVRARVLKGGHDVPEEDQRRRFPRTLANLCRLLPTTDFAILIDNSTYAGYQLVAFGHKASMHWNETVPEWAQAIRVWQLERLGVKAEPLTP